MASSLRTNWLAGRRPARFVKRVLSPDDAVFTRAGRMFWRPARTSSTVDDETWARTLGVHQRPRAAEENCSMASQPVRPRSSGPLAGVRILDLSRILSGPFATMILADLGADVIKLEDPRTGDDTRQWAPPYQGDESAYFLAVNRNKRGIAVDLKTTQGREIALRLADRADVVVENFRPGTASALGLGYDDLIARKPSLIYASISGFGQTGP